MKMQKVRFTGKRTGLDAYVIPNVGRVGLGDTVEVDEETADQWTRPLPTADGSEKSDFEKVGKPKSEGSTESNDTTEGGQ